MYNNILIPVSFSPNRDTDSAIKVAEALRADGAKITFLHVIEDLPTYALPLGLDDFILQAREAAQSELDKLTAKVAGSKGVQEGGHAGRNILDHAKREGNDLIIVASHQPGFQDYVIGSTAAHVVRNAHCAVHVVR